MRRITTIIASVIAITITALFGAVVWNFRSWAEKLPRHDELIALDAERVAMCSTRGVAHPSALPSVSLADIPPVTRDAFLAAEDQQFWDRPPSNPFIDILRAALFNSRPEIGVISQSLSRQIIACLQETRSLEYSDGLGGYVQLSWAMVYRLDRELTKQQILELYMNSVYLGHNAYGVAAAAQAYFGKPLNALSLGESAFLAAMPRAPNLYCSQPDRVMARRSAILDDLAKSGHATAADVEHAKAEPISVRCPAPTAVP